jgi:tetratricopeptide (TPR) repeat protein
MSQGREQITIAVIFAAWLAYQAQSFISIDNLAIAIWGYILGGAVVGISLSPDKRVSVQQRDSILQPLISSVLALAFLALSALFLQSESAMKTLSSTQTPKSQSELSAYEAIAQKPLSSVFHEAAFSVTVAGDLAQANDLGTAVTDLQKVIDADPRFYDAMELLARIYEYQKNWPAAAQVRQKMLPLDPFNKALQEQITQDRNGGVTKSK